jgi:basic membrane protein A
LAVTPLVILSTIAISACGSSKKSSSSSASSSAAPASSSSSSGGAVKIGAALIGPKNDNSFNQAAYEGILKAQQTDPSLKLTATLENRGTDQTRTDAVNTLAPLNNVVLGVSASFGPIFDATADNFPKDSFVDVAGYTARFHKNVYAFANDWGSPAYVGGVIAATLTKSNTIGYVGGAEIPPTTQGEAGFIAGAKSIKPGVKVLTNITGDFNDVAKAKATAAMITDGADVVFPFLDAGIAGSYQAGKDSGKNPAMFKLTIPDCTSYANIVGTEVVNNVAATSAMLVALHNGKLKPGAIFLDLQDPQVQTLKLCPKYQANPKVAAITAKTIAGVNDKSIKIPPNALNQRPSYPFTEGFPPGVLANG